MWSGETACSQPPSALHAVDVHDVRADALDRGAHLVEHAREVLDVRLGGGVADDASCPGVSAAAISAFSVPITDGSSMKKSVERRPPLGAVSGCRGRARPARRARGRRRGAGRGGGGRSRRRPAAASARSRSAPAAARRPGRRRGCARPGRGRRRCRRSPSACSATVLSSIHSTRDAEVGEQREHRLHVADARDVGEHDPLLGEQAGGQERQGRVLVAGGHDGAGQRHAALDDELFHGRAAG